MSQNLTHLVICILNNMPVIGLTGNLSSGKSTLLNLFKKRGAVTFNADENIHKYYEDRKSGIYKAISKAFPQVVGKTGINRKVLGEIVFSKRSKLRQLERIVHPKAIKDLKSWLKKTKKPEKICIAEVPLLFEKDLQKLFDVVVLVYVKKKVLIERIKNNLNISETAARKRLSFYKPMKEKIRGSDFIINNSFDAETFKKEVDILWEKMNQN